MLELFRSRISCLAPILSLARTKSPKLFIRARVKPSAGQAIRVEDTNIGCGPKDKTIAGRGQPSLSTRILGGSPLGFPS